MLIYKIQKLIKVTNTVKEFREADKMKCTNPNCSYKWTPRTKKPKTCPKCRQYLKEGEKPQKENKFRTSDGWIVFKARKSKEVKNE